MPQVPGNPMATGPSDVMAPSPTDMLMAKALHEQAKSTSIPKGQQRPTLPARKSNRKLQVVK